MLREPLYLVSYFKKWHVCFFAKFYPDADPETFKGSTGWLRKFNLRQSIKNTASRGEILSADLSADLSAIDLFRDEFQKLIESEGLSPFSALPN